MPMGPAASEGLDWASSSRAETINGPWRLAAAFRRSMRCLVPVDAVESPLQCLFLVGDVGMRSCEEPSPSDKCQFISS